MSRLILLKFNNNSIFERLLFYLSMFVMSVFLTSCLKQEIELKAIEETSNSVQSIRLRSQSESYTFMHEGSYNDSCYFITTDYDSIDVLNIEPISLQLAHLEQRESISFKSENRSKRLFHADTISSTTYLVALQSQDTAIVIGLIHLKKPTVYCEIEYAVLCGFLNRNRLNPVSDDNGRSYLVFKLVNDSLVSTGVLEL